MHLIVDGNNFAFRTFHSGYRRIINVDGQEISVLQAVLMMLRGLLSNLENIDDIVFCWDSNEPDAKRKIFPEYKSQREDGELKQILHQQINILQEYLPFFGIKQLYYPSIEADDIIFVLVKILNHFNKECLIVSADKDLLQLVGPLCKVFNINKKRTYKVSNFEELTGVCLDGFIDYLALIGDRVDNIDGVKGIGPETAKKIINMYGCCDNLFSKENEIRAMISLGQVDTSFSHRLVSIFEEENKKKISRNKDLITLGKYLSLEEKKQIIKDYEAQKNIRINESAISDFFKRFHMLEIYQDVGLFLVPFMHIKNNR